MKPTVVATLPVLSISLLLTSPVGAQDCGSPASLVALYKSGSSQTVKTLMYAEYAQMSYNEAKDNQGVQAMYKGFGLGLSNESHTAVQNEIKKSDFSASLSDSRNEVVLTYGDTNLVEAYKACLGTLPALRIQEIQPGRESTTFEVTYLANIDHAPLARIDAGFLADLESQGAHVLSQNCAQKEGLGNGGKCRIALRYPSAPKREVRVVIKSDVGSAHLYIPPRLVFDVRPVGDIPQKYNNGLKEVVVEQIYPNSATAQGCTDALPEGEYIVVTGEGASRSPVIQAGSHPNYSGMIVSDLRLLAANGLQKKVCFQFNCRYGGGAGADGQGRSCVGRLNGNVVKVGWFPK